MTHTPTTHDHEDLSLVVLSGRLATDAEVRTFDSGAEVVRLLVTTRVSVPRTRVDVIPVTFWDLEPDHKIRSARKGERVWVCGSVQRRYWESPDGRRSRVEIVGEQVNVGAPAVEDDPADFLSEHVEVIAVEL